MCQGFVPVHIFPTPQGEKEKLYIGMTALAFEIIATFFSLII